MANVDPAAFAAQFLAAARTRTAIATPPSALDAAFDLDAAYDVEANFALLRVESGHRIAGRKVGYASKAVWRILKLKTLVWAHMYDDTVLFDTSELPASKFRTPRLEPEIVIKLKQPLAAGLSAIDVVNAVEWVALGFEIIDCPFPGWQFQPADFVAAYGLHAALVVGEPTPVDASFVERLAAFKLRLLKNGQLVEQGAGRNSLGSPALCVAELASAAQQRGEPLTAGELISTGTLTQAQPVAAGDLWQAEVDGLPLAPLVLGFTEH